MASSSADLKREQSDFNLDSATNFRANLEMQIGQRILASMVDKITERKNLITFTSATGAVFVLAFAEGLLLCKKPHYRFALRYGTENVFPSITHSTKNAGDCARALGVSKSILIKNAETPAQARQLLRAESCKTTRNILFGMIGVAAAVRIMDLESEATNAFNQNVMSGKEPLLEDIKERVIRFMGDQSDVTELSVKRHGHHIVPIIEHPHIQHGSMSPDYQHFVSTITEHGAVPSVWRVKDGKYGRLSSWVGLRLHRDWLLKTAAGKHVLVLEADCSPGQQSLAEVLMEENDLDHYEVTQGFHTITTLARKQGVLRDEEGDMAFRVMVCDQNVKMVMGGGQTFDFR
jgi:hypothetical protein